MAADLEVRMAARRDARAIARVRDLHTETTEGEDCVYCNHCGFTWPCGTIEALDQP